MRRYLLAVLALVAAPVAAEEQPPMLSLERVFASPSLNGPVTREVKLSPDGRFVTLLRNRADDRERYDLWAFDRTAGDWRMLVDSLKLGSGRQLSEAEKMQRERLRIGDLKGIVTYQWAADGKSLLVPVEGGLYLAGLDGTSRRIEGTGEGALDPTLSPKGAWISFLRDRRLWTGRVGGAAPRAITPPEKADTVHWGEAEFVAQEEMDRRVGAWWAPDDSRIAVERFDEAPVGVVTRAAIGADGTKTYEQRYPVAGSANADVRLFTMRPDGSGRVEVDLGPERDIYLARVDWGPDAKTLYVQRENREQTRLDLLAADPVSGATRLLFSEQAAPGSWIELTDNYRFLADRSLIWWSERDGFGHLYHYAGGQWRQLTKGAWVVKRLVGVDEAKGRVYFTATKDDVLAGQVYALDLANPDAIERLTDPAFANDARMDANGQTLIVTRSSPVQPTQSYLANTAGERIAWIEENALDADHPYTPYLPSHVASRFGTIPATDGNPLHWLMLSPKLEPGKRYPVFFDHYGGPGSQQVTRAWQGALRQAIVDMGYIYFLLDNRGSPNRGVKFASALNRALGTVEVEDQLAGAAYLKTLDFVDPDKIATFGWSYGGYMTLKMLQASPGTFAAGVAVAPVSRWELYDTHYTERFLGSPKSEPSVYERANVLADTAKIADPLLLIHGMADDNVVFENSSTLIAKLQGEAVPFEMMLYPGYTHSISGPKVSVHLYRTIFDFFAKHGAGPAP
jgi:dipeptidyl-peptidase 4